MNNLLKRSFTGLLIVGIIISGLLINSLSFFIVFLGIMMLTLWEFYHLVHMIKVRAQVKLGLFMAFLLFTLIFLLSIQALDIKYLSLLLIFFPFVFINELFAERNRPFHNIAYTFLGLTYIALPFSLLSLLSFDMHEKIQPFFTLDGQEDILNFLLQPGYVIDYSPYLLLGVFIIIWLYDTGAYLTGMIWGKHKLYRRISPKKSWEGVIGGTVIALITGIILSRYFKEITQFEWVMIVLVIVFFGTLGDLVESMLKRRVGVKDSGHILPGHGGFLDRFDGFLLAIPVIVTLIEFFKG